MLPQVQKKKKKKKKKKMSRKLEIWKDFFSSEEEVKMSQLQCPFLKSFLDSRPCNFLIFLTSFNEIFSFSLNDKSETADKKEIKLGFFFL